MKARIFKTESQIRKIVQEEAKRQTTEIYDAALRDATYQAFAVMMCVLHNEFGFGGKRLRKLKDRTEDEFMLMRNGMRGQKYDTMYCVRYLKDKFGIDFNESQYDSNGKYHVRSVKKMNFEEKMKKIMEHYGYERQREQFVEECAEAIQAAQKCKRRGSKEDFEHFMGELADVIIMATQIYNFMDTTKVDEIIDQKLDRQLKRIEDD